MIIYPAIDLFQGKAVRLYQGDYAQMTVYKDDPVQAALELQSQGAARIHLVDLEGAKSGSTPNLETVCAIKRTTGLFCQVGGGVRSMEVVDRYLSGGIDRVILGTAAVTDREFLRSAVEAYGEKIAVGVDIRDGFVAIRGWTEKSAETALEFCEKMCMLGVRTLICTDISKDGAMEGANHDLYRQLRERYDGSIIASGGVSSLEDVKRLARQGIHGAIIGKAYYTGALDLAKAMEAAR